MVSEKNALPCSTKIAYLFCDNTHNDQCMKETKKIQNSWAMFDWANSSFTLIITVAIFPPYLLNYATEPFPFLGFDILPGSLLSFSLSIAYFLVVILSPLIGGIADYSGKRKLFMKLFTYLGGIACMSMFFFDSTENLWIGVAGFILATIGYSGSLMIYNSYLPLITTEDNFDKLSAKGYTYGYIGSVILLVFCLVMISFPYLFGIETGSNLPIRLSFLFVGMWWIGFAQIAFWGLPSDTKGKIRPHVINKGWNEIRKVGSWVKQMPNTKSFLLTFLVYTAGVQTVLFLATTFAESVLNLGTSKLILVILILQIIAILGAYFFAFVSSKKGNIFTIQAMLIIWVLVCFLAYSVTEEWQFFIIAGLVGLVMGGIQSISRSTYSKLVQGKPKDLSSFFAFYDVLEKVAIIAGTFSFGIVNQLTGNIRYSIFVLATFFVVSFFLTLRIKSIDQNESYSVNS